MVKTKLTGAQIQELNTLVEADTRANPYIRNGQSYFNNLCEISPETAEEIRGTSVDPFYNDTIIGEFFQAII